MLIDTHCHLDDSAFSSDLELVIARARAAGVEKFIIPGVAPSGWTGVARVASRTPALFPAFGVHPMHADLFSASVGAELERILPGAVAMGEIGLDYVVTHISREVQMVAFREQLKLSVRCGLPVIIHCRRAFADLFRICREEHVERVGGVMHAFSGSVEIAKECLRLELFISIAGPVTFPNAVKPLHIVRTIPLEHLVLETDSPDLAPESHRGCRNEPAFLESIAHRVAFLKEVQPEVVHEQTSANAEKLFRLTNFDQGRGTRNVPFT